MTPEPRMEPAAWVVIGACAASVGWVVVLALVMDRARERYEATRRACLEATEQVGHLYRVNARMARLVIDTAPERAVGEGDVCGS